MKALSWKWAIAMVAAVLAGPAASAQTPKVAALPPATFAITLGNRDACVTPETRVRARADGGIIDVQAATADAFTVAMTGTPAADSYMCCTSTAIQSFHLVQEFEVTCSDPAVKTVSLAVDSSLLGYVRSKHKASACMRLANATITSQSGEGPIVALAYPSRCCSGTQGMLCNQRLAPVKGDSMPLGHFTLIADFVLDVTASGVCNAHAVADFSPDTALPAEWVRMRDPFQGVAKKSFGFNFSVTATASTASSSAADSTARLQPPQRAGMRRTTRNIVEKKSPGVVLTRNRVN